MSPIETDYRTLFESIDQGFCLVELLYDQSHNAVDYRFVEVNSVFERQTGYVNAKGKRATELSPNVQQAWIDTVDNVARTGEPLRTEAFFDDPARWYAITMSRLGATSSPLVASVFDDITARKHYEHQQQFLFELNDALRPLTSAVELQKAAMQVVAHQLDVMRATYFEVAPDQDTFYLTARYERDAVPIPDQMRLSDFSPNLANEYRTGRILSVSDTEIEPLREAYRAIGVRAWAAVPLLKDGQLVAIVGVHANIPRHWTNAEVTLLEAVAERTWAAVERAKAEAVLRESEERYRTLFESMDEGFHISELLYDQAGQATDWRFLAVNAVFEQQTGLQNVVGQLGSLVAPGTESYWLQTYDQAIKTGQPQRLENFNGVTKRWYSAQANRVGALGSRRFVVIFQDITTHRRWQAQQALLAELTKELAELTSIDQTMRTVGKTIGDYFQVSWCMFSELVQERQLSVASYGWHHPGVPSIAGTYHMQDFLTPQQAERNNAGELTIVDDVQLDARVSAQQYGLLGIRSFIIVPLARRGEWRFLLSIIDLKPRYWPADEVALLQEIAARLWGRLERARAEEALRDSEQRLAQAIDIGGIGHWSLDLTTYALTTSAHCRANFGRSEVLPFSYAELLASIHPADREHQQQSVREAIHQQTDFQVEYRVVTPQKAIRWVHIQGRYVTVETPQLIGVSMNITAWKRAEEALRETDRRKDEFLAMLAHELRNPLAPIRGGLQLLSLRDQPDPMLGSLLPVMNRQMDHLIRMLDDLLDVSRISRGTITLHLQVIDLTQVVAQAVEAMQPAYETAGRQLHRSLPPRALLVNGDATRLQQVVTNLLTNGIRYTGEGGQVWLTLTAVGSEAVLRVSDNGIGLAVDQLTAIFELFVQVETALARANNGLGLGLSLVQQLVTLHGGRVEAFSPGLDQGSDFVIHLPLLTT